MAFTSDLMSILNARVIIVLVRSTQFFICDLDFTVYTLNCVILVIGNYVAEFELFCFKVMKNEGWRRVRCIVVRHL